MFAVADGNSTLVQHRFDEVADLNRSLAIFSRDDDQFTLESGLTRDAFDRAGAGVDRKCSVRNEADAHAL